MENSLAGRAWTLRNRSSASAAASKAGPRLAEVAGRASSRACGSRFLRGGRLAIGFEALRFAEPVKFNCPLFLKLEPRRLRLAREPAARAVEVRAQLIPFRELSQQKDRHDGTLK